MAHWICTLIVLVWAPEFKSLELTKSWPSTSCNSSVGAGVKSNHWSLPVTGLAPVSLRLCLKGRWWKAMEQDSWCPPQASTWIHRYPSPHTCRQKDFIQFQGSMTLSGKVPVSHRYFYYVLGRVSHRIKDSMEGRVCLPYLSEWISSSNSALTVLFVLYQEWCSGGEKHQWVQIGGLGQYIFIHLHSNRWYWHYPISLC